LFIAISTLVRDAAKTVDRFSRCLDDVEGWLSSLNPAKAQVLWPGSKCQLLKLDIQHVPVLTTSVRIVHSARDLGVRWSKVDCRCLMTSLSLQAQPVTYGRGLAVIRCC